MRASIVALAIFAASAPAFAQQPNELACADFLHNADGSWTPTRPITFTSPSGALATLSPGARLQHGLLVMGVDIADQLDSQCH